MTLHNPITGFLGTSATKAIIPGLALSIPFFLASIVFLQLSPYAQLANGAAFKGIVFGAILLGLLTAYLFVFTKSLLSYPSTIHFNGQTIRISYRFAPKVEYASQDIVGVSRDATPGRHVTLRFEMRNGKSFPAMINLYQSKALYSYLSNLGLTVF
ncbi:hypothetical protein IEN85_20530 [Pelagicoccus sp. NFK12]|uniref:Uncharacterized protein n=1 Tax=Pelagicoccus enzymogenes TaxID=2773457 RepID=A0A927FBP1_9BACT|nr:hypothetical protein [Pelagicoccus enzymogenes]MBD5781899.1 hypothetical protein [Pelagicoccus enzymogenes]